ncbi:DUF4350 domain-containing protein [Chitinophaga cymbidii]|uniref:DUF4350 domain-containing protein n=1 Tax=Chitinophaga cymbidii TaxID=1096750 RepID=A0A512RET3_9BACT|nr:DUF4350 domain-containing protein [Chitinophaga cymbidii]GEP94209.1 hypothetical protein CCY01nite_04690 [Chitinophaga cymbidii]
MRTLALLLFPAFAMAQQVSDTAYHYPLAKVMYTADTGPLILFDQAHNNPHTLKGRYAAFGDLLRQDGYQVEPAREKLTPALLRPAKIFVSANALYDRANWDLPTGSAYTENEVKILHDWVQNGGSLFLLTDHMPCGASVNTVALSFGFNVVNGYAARTDRQEEIFTKKKGNLHQHAVTRGIDSLMVWGGTGFLAPAGAQVIASLGAGYEIFLPSKAEQITDTTPRLSGLGFVNAASLEYGRGRIVVFGDGAPFTAQLEGIYSRKRGMNHPKAGQNAPLLLNIIHWLDRKL